MNCNSCLTEHYLLAKTLAFSVVLLLYLLGAANMRCNAFFLDTGIFEKYNKALLQPVHILHSLCDYKRYSHDSEITIFARSISALSFLKRLLNEIP